MPLLLMSPFGNRLRRRVAQRVRQRSVTHSWGFATSPLQDSVEIFLRVLARVFPKPRVKAYGDGRGGFGLTLHVHPTGVKSWQQRVLLNGRQTNIGLGLYPAYRSPRRAARSR